MKAFVTGGAGYVGSHLVDLLVKEKHQVVVYDNLSTGTLDNIDRAVKFETVKFVYGDILDPVRLCEHMYGADVVFHVAANADIRNGLKHPRHDLEQNIIGTHNVLEAMRGVGCEHIAFTSTCSVYGEQTVTPIPENPPFPTQTSLYSASKVAGEALIQAYCEGYGFQSYITRHVGMVGERYAHGHLIDFFHRIQETGKLKILGDGTLRKSYLYVGDAVRGILTAVQEGRDKINIYNLGSEEVWTVRQSAEAVCEEMGLSADAVETSEGLRGWVGDNNYIKLDSSRIRALGWEPQVSVREGIHRTIAYLKERYAVTG